MLSTIATVLTIYVIATYVSFFVGGLFESLNIHKTKLGQVLFLPFSMVLYVAFATNALAAWIGVHAFWWIQ
jgi:hypothetical protein